MSVSPDEVGARYIVNEWMNKKTAGLAWEDGSAGVRERTSGMESESRVEEWGWLGSENSRFFVGFFSVSGKCKMGHNMMGFSESKLLRDHQCQSLTLQGKQTFQVDKQYLVLSLWIISKPFSR